MILCWGWLNATLKCALLSHSTMPQMSQVEGACRDTVTTSGSPLLCYSSATITSCFNMIMHSPTFQGSVHNSWKLKLSQFFHGLHTSQTCHSLSMFGMLWINVYDIKFSCLATSHGHWRGVGQHSIGYNQQPDQLYAKEMSCCMKQVVVTPDTDWFSDPWSYLHFFFINLWLTDAYLHSQSFKIHRLGPNSFISIDWFPDMNCKTLWNCCMWRLYFCCVY